MVASLRPVCRHFDVLGFQGPLPAGVVWAVKSAFCHNLGVAESSESLFQQFIDGNRASLRRIRLVVSDNEPETTMLDFKRNADRGVEVSRMTDDSKDHLSRCASAFANTEGGIIVWGVESKDYKANSLQPIPNIAQFAQELNTQTAATATSHVAGIRTIYVEDEAGTGAGFAVTYVPRSFVSPHQATREKVKNYWMRVGILADTLQEWDRYSSHRDSIFTGELPLSSVNVKMRSFDGRCEIDYGRGDLAKHVRDELDKVLNGWDTILTVLPSDKDPID